MSSAPTRPRSPPPSRTVLLGWELGDGLGHVQQLARLARALAAAGLHPVVAVKNLALAGAFFRDLPCPVLQAPFWHPRPWTGSQPFLAASYADLLAIRGWTDAADLLPMVQGWQGLLDLVRPALVVCDHSPTLCLAAYRALPTVVLGHAFAIPPAEEPTFPPLVPGKQGLVPEGRLLEVVQEVQRRRGRPAPDTLPGLFAAAERLLTFLPELDPYRALRAEPHLGPLGFALPRPLPPPAQPAFFAYLTADVPCAEQILEGLARAGCPGTAYLRGAAPEARRRLRRTGLEILDSPAPVDEVLARAAVVVHHGSAGLAQQALAAGRPQLLFADHLERILNAQLIHQLGAGLYLTGEFPAQAVPEALRRLAGEPGFTERAQAAADALARRGPWDPLPRVVERCLALSATAP
jgi:rhamnosyltransferase subunit B